MGGRGRAGGRRARREGGGRAPPPPNPTSLHHATSTHHQHHAHLLVCGCKHDGCWGRAGGGEGGRAGGEGGREGRRAGGRAGGGGGKGGGRDRGGREGRCLCHQKTLLSRLQRRCKLHARQVRIECRRQWWRRRRAVGGIALMVCASLRTVSMPSSGKALRRKTHPRAG